MGNSIKPADAEVPISPLCKSRRRFLLTIICSDSAAV
jgi:hypothetical protein